MIYQVLSALEHQLNHPALPGQQQYKLSYHEQGIVNALNDLVQTNNSYQSLLVAHYYKQLNYLTHFQKTKLKKYRNCQ